ncbi:MAG: methyltransferase domain-containing protein [Candidatus Paceibacterota bacterium]|jgi:ubiquinone/menaquinone biosynthesis C-methylase UbiE
MWNIIAREYDTLITRGDFFRTHLLDPEVLSCLGHVAGKTILDVGCGQGYFSYILSTKGAIITGIDGAPEMITYANKHYPESSILHFSVADATQPLLFPDASFDGALANMVLMDISDITTLIQELRRVVRPRGFFVFSILHPFFSVGKIGKHIGEIVRGELPHYELKHYHTPRAIPWHIPHTSHETVVYHRPLEYYMNALSQNGWHVTEFHEPVFDPQDVLEKSNAKKLLAEIPPLLVIRAE